jgi:Fe(3+) dicitrate transport protein
MHSNATRFPLMKYLINVALTMTFTFLPVFGQSATDQGLSSVAIASASSNVLSSGRVHGAVYSNDTNEPLIGANILVIGTRLGAATDNSGRFILSNLPPGNYTLQVSMLGYSEKKYSVTVRENETSTLDVVLSPRPVDLPTVEIMGSPSAVFLKIPGSAETVGHAMIASTHPVGFNEVLRRVSGINVRDEEGLGIRPNIGIRGLFPTRSGKVLLLEDGIPLTQAPYGDPAAYYHPPINRFDRIEVLKGSGQILFGPQTIGGVINYLTPQPPAKTAATAKMMAGNRDYFFSHADIGSTWGPVGFFADYTRKQGSLARENTSTAINDVSGKLVWKLDGRSKLSVKGNFYQETSNLTYAGLTKIEFEENPFQNQFKDDWFYIHRYGSHLIYDRYLDENGAAFALNVYAYKFQRDWWRQGNNGGTNSTNPGNTPDVRTVRNPTRNDGRNRAYNVWGIEPRFRMNHRLFGVLHETDFGIRGHFEVQDRKQIEGNSPTARTGVLRENNLRETSAYAAFLQDRIFIGNRWTFSGGVRIENIRHRRTNRLNDASGTALLTEVIPGIGATFNPTPDVTFYTGIHRGFAPPRVEDAISNTDGSSVELDAEKSWNVELGIRAKPFSGAEVHATAFQMDFENQIVPASLAGGSATTLTNAGRTFHRGIEVRSTLSLPLPQVERYTLLLDAAYTYLPDAEFRGERYSTLDKARRVTGNRLTYAPEHLITASMGIAEAERFSFRLEAVFVGKQFSDDLNTVAITANGRQGILPSHTVWNFSGNYTIEPLSLTMVMSVKNVFDKLYVVDLSRGMLPGSPRLFQYGLEWKF